MAERPRPIAFRSNQTVSLTDNRYKIIRIKPDAPYELYDLVADPKEQVDIAAKHPGVVDRMRQTFRAWHKSCQNSAAGKDY